MLQEHSGVPGLKVVKCHGFAPEIGALFELGQACGIHAFRDVRDATASWVRLSGKPFGSVFPRFVRDYLRECRRWTALGEKVMSSRYEELVEDRVEEVRRIATFLGLDVDDGVVVEVSDLLSPERQRERSEAFDRARASGAVDRSSPHDSHSLLHVDHISDGSEAPLPWSQVAMIEQLAGSWLVTHGYSIAFEAEVSVGRFEQVKVLKENSVYRVADVVLQRGGRWERDRATILEDPVYEGTVLRTYLEEKRFEKDFLVLGRVVREQAARRGFATPPDDALVVHLRLGDVMDGRRFYAPNAKVSRETWQVGRFRCPCGWNGELPLKLRAESKEVCPSCCKRKAEYRSPVGVLHPTFRWYSNLREEIQRSKIEVSRAIVVTALHFGANELNGEFFYSERAESNSFRLLSIVVGQLESLGLPVTIQSSEDVDEDLCFMAGSRYYFKGFSMMSDLVAECLEPAARSLSFDPVMLR